MLFGIKASRPDTAYGYLRQGRPADLGVETFVAMLNNRFHNVRLRLPEERVLYRERGPLDDRCLISP